MKKQSDYNSLTFPLPNADGMLSALKITDATNVRCIIHITGGQEGKGEGKVSFHGHEVPRRRMQIIFIFIPIFISIFILIGQITVMNRVCVSTLWWCLLFVLCMKS